MSKFTAVSEPVFTAIDRSHPPPTGTWTINPAATSVSLAWRKVRLWTVTGRLPCLDVVHLDDVPPVGVIRVQQPSGLPVRTMALDPLSEETKTQTSIPGFVAPTSLTSCSIGVPSA